MKTKILTFYGEKPKRYESNTMPSMTFPDTSMSVPELLNRYSQGQPIGQQMRITDPADLEYERFKAMDLIDKQNFLKRKTEEAKELRSKHNEKVKHETQKALREQIEKEIKDKQKEEEEIKKSLTTNFK